MLARVIVRVDLKWWAAKSLEMVAECYCARHGRELSLTCSPGQAETTEMHSWRESCP